MLNYNGKLISKDQKFIEYTNRGLLFGDAVFEEIRVVNNHIHFLEDHYLKLMASMRILRMEIPMEFTLEFIEEQVLKTISKLDVTASYNIKLLVFREGKGTTLPKNNTISYYITATQIAQPFFVLSDDQYEVELFKDFYKNANMLSTLSTTNTVLKVVASVYAEENDYQDCLLLNENKSVVESLYGNLFLVKGNTIKTPPLKDGCLNGVLRKKLIEVLEKLEEFTITQESISPFELQKADELFLVHNITGITAISKYRKKVFSNSTAKNLVGKLNAFARLNLSEN